MQSIGILIDLTEQRLYVIDTKYNKITKVYAGPYCSFNKGFRVLGPGDRGGDVYYIQKELKEINYYSGSLDGIYGETLKKSVIKLRRDRNLKESHFIDKEFYALLGIKYFE